MVARGAAPLKGPRWAVVTSRCLSPLPATLAATVLAALSASTARPVVALLTVVGLFGGALLAALALVRLVWGPGSLTRRRVVPVALAFEVAALVVGWSIGVPPEVFRAFGAFFAAGLAMLAGARANVSAHCLAFGTLTGLLLGWFPAWGAGAVALLLLLVAARVSLRQHTLTQALAGAAAGCVIGTLAAAAFA